MGKFIVLYQISKPKKIQNEELIDNRFKDLIMFGADSYE